MLEDDKHVLREKPVQCIEIENAIRREMDLPELDLSPAFGIEAEAEAAQGELLEVQDAPVTGAPVID